MSNVTSYFACTGPPTFQYAMILTAEIMSLSQANKKKKNKPEVGRSQAQIDQGWL